MRIVSVNVNGLRSAARKGFFTWLQNSAADIVCLQEVRATLEQLDDAIYHPEGWHFELNPAERAGYSGVAIYSRVAPIKTVTKLRLAEFSSEGRYLEAHWPGLKVVSVYVPSGSSSPERQAAKYRFLDEFSLHLDKLNKGQDGIAICGDWNIAHTPLDICNDKSNVRTPGFLPAERAWLSNLLGERGWVDAFRSLFPQEEAAGYTWWSNRGQAWANNVGWRIDYQFINQRLAPHLSSAAVYKAQRFSDHAPLLVDFDDALRPGNQLE